MHVERLPVPRRAPSVPAALPTLRLEDGLPADATAWSALAEASGNVFVTPEWASTWWERFGDGRRAVSAALREADGELGALAVLCVSTRGPLRTVRFVGHGPADELGPACRPDRRAGALAALAMRAREAGLGDVLVGEQLRGDVGWGAGASVLDRGGSPVIRFAGGDWPSFVAGLSSNLRRQVRKIERQLSEEPRLALRLATDPERLDADLDAFFALHRARFGPSSGFLPSRRVEEFHRAFARLAFERGWLRLWLLEARGRPEAAWYGFRYGGGDSLYQAGRSAAAKGMGTALLAWTVRCALEDGLAEYRFLRGSEDYKYRWANEDPGLLTLAAPLTRAGRVAVGLARRRDGASPRPRIAPPGPAGRLTRRLLLRT